jgi:hypothetical protein
VSVTTGDCRRGGGIVAVKTDEDAVIAYSQPSERGLRSIARSRPFVPGRNEDRDEALASRRIGKLPAKARG